MFLGVKMYFEWWELKTIEFFVAMKPKDAD